MFGGYEHDPASNYDYVRNSDTLVNLWEELGEFVNKYPNLFTWDEVMEVNQEWSDMRSPLNKKRMVFFNYRMKGDTPESIKMCLRMNQ